MFIGFPKCAWKCEKECGKKGICQNSALAQSPDIEISPQDVVTRYMSNPISKAIVMGGLEPFDTWGDLIDLIKEFRTHTQDDIVIYTGYEDFEINDRIDYLKQNYTNIVVKFGRFIPDKIGIYSAVLGVILASNNQHAWRIC